MKYSLFICALLLLASIESCTEKRTIDKGETFFELTERAENGDSVAQYLLASCYKNGTGVEPNKEKMVEWYRKSAIKGYDSACYQLGNCYMKGDGILKNDYLAVFGIKKPLKKE